MGTLTEEIFGKKLGREVKAGEMVVIDVDRIMSHDVLSVLAIEAMEKLAGRPFDPGRIVIPFDHIVPAANIEQAKIQKRTREFIKKHGIAHFQSGVCHQVMIENGFVLPNDIIIGSDSHTCSYGALGAFGTGMGSTDIGVAYATGKAWFRVPESVLIEINGKFQKGVYAKDLIMKIIAKIGVDGANYKALEFAGEAVKSMGISERITLSNMAIEAGAKAGLIEADEKTMDYLKGRTRKRLELRNFARPKKAKYESAYKFSVSNLEPQVACPHDLDNLKAVREVEGIPIDEIFIGTCTNGRYEDLEIAASIMKNRKVDRFTRTIVIPASVEVYQKAMKNGLIKIFQDAGCIVCNPGCGPCIGRHQGVLAPGEKALTTMNRNFRGRMGSPDAEIYIASPATCAASAVAGKITDPRGCL